jgi:hypothetical protein
MERPASPGQPHPFQELLEPRVSPEEIVGRADFRVTSSPECSAVEHPMVGVDRDEEVRAQMGLTDQEKADLEAFLKTL